MPEHENPLLSLVGDVMVRTSTVRDHLEAKPGFQAAQDMINSHQLSFLNMEFPVSDRPGYKVTKWGNLRSDPEVMKDIKLLKPSAVSLANNHMMDFGPEVLMDTVAACKAAGIPAAGAGKDIDQALAPVVLESQGIKIGMLAVATTLPPESDAGLGKPGIAPLRVKFSYEVDWNLTIEQPGMMPTVQTWIEAEEMEPLLERVRQLKQDVDVVVVAIHWGVPSFWMSPSQGLLAEYQQPLAHELIDAGADIIWGHHSHVLHPVEVYKGRPILYSLSNYIFENPRDFMEPESLIVSVTQASPLAIELIPVWVDEEGFPHLARGEVSEAVFSLLSEISAPFGIELSPSANGMSLKL